MHLRDSQARESILAATTATSAGEGYSALSVAAICAASGLSEATFHRHFGDAEDAFCAVVEAGTEELLNRALPAFIAQPRWADGLRAVAYVLRDFLAEDPARARVMVIDSFSACERSRKIREQGMAALAALIDFGRAELDDPDSVPKATAELTAGAIYNRIHAAVEGGEELGDEMVRELMYTAVNRYLGTKAALAELQAPAIAGGDLGA